MLETLLHLMIIHLRIPNHFKYVVFVQAVKYLRTNLQIVKLDNYK